MDSMQSVRQSKAKIDGNWTNRGRRKRKLYEMQYLLHTNDYAGSKYIILIQDYDYDYSSMS